MKKTLRQQRYFDISLKKEVVKQVESGKLGVTAASREYGVTTQTIYQWLHKHSKNLNKNEVIVVKKKDQETMKKELEQRVAELERIVGKKQMEIDYLNKLIEIASEEEKN